MKAVKFTTGQERGAALVEYGVLVGLIAVSAIFAVSELGDNVAENFTDTSEAIALAAPSGTSPAPGGSTPPPSGTPNTSFVFAPQDFSIDSYLEPGTPIHTVVVTGDPVASYSLIDAPGLAIDNAGVITAVDLAAFTAFGTTRPITVVATAADASFALGEIQVARADATDPSVEWYMWQMYDVVWVHGDSGWPETFGAVESGPGMDPVAIEQVCIDEAARLNAEPLPYPWSNPRFYDYFTFTPSAGGFGCSGRKREQREGNVYFYNLASSTDETWYESYLNTGTENGGQIENARFVGIPYRW